MTLFSFSLSTVCSLIVILRVNSESLTLRVLYRGWFLRRRSSSDFRFENLFDKFLPILCRRSRILRIKSGAFNIAADSRRRYWLSRVNLIQIRNTVKRQKGNSEQQLSTGPIYYRAEYNYLFNTLERFRLKYKGGTKGIFSQHIFFQLREIRNKKT